MKSNYVKNQFGEEIELSTAGMGVFLRLVWKRPLGSFEASAHVESTGTVEAGIATADDLNSLYEGIQTMNPSCRRTLAGHLYAVCEGGTTPVGAVGALLAFMASVREAKAATELVAA